MRKKIILALFTIVISFSVGIFIWAALTGKIRPRAEGNVITNMATVTYEDTASPPNQYSGQSNMVTTEILSSTTININLALRLQGKDRVPLNYTPDYSSIGTTIWVFDPGERNPANTIFTTNTVETNSAGQSTVLIAMTGITAGNSYDVKIKVNYYLTKTLINQTLSDGMTLDFSPDDIPNSELLAGNLNNTDDIVSGADYFFLTTKWYQADPLYQADINKDGIVSGADYFYMTINWYQTGS